MNSPPSVCSAPTSVYLGRFAPSPTGPLHFGSLFAAVVSYLHARKNGGKWLVRMEDIDPLREQPGAASAILKTLESHGLYWDAPVAYQSKRSSIYEAYIEKFLKSGTCFYCPCSRKQLASNNGAHSPECIAGHVDPSECALKYRGNKHHYTWLDSFQGAHSLSLDHDFVLKRKEGFYAYQLAVVADDIEQGVSHVIRGYDLLDSTPMQLALYQSLNVPVPEFGHFPVIVSQSETHNQPQKLSKQNLAPAVSDVAAIENLQRVFNYLSLSIDVEMLGLEDALKQAVKQWDEKSVVAKQSLTLESV